MNKGINKYLGAIVMGTALLAVPSCTDTWNEHYQTESGETTASETLWEVLENREDLSNFCNIIAKAKFYRDENHPAFTMNGKDTVYYTFKDVLSANTPITVWAPVNTALSAEEWQKYEEMAKNEGYNLQQQFIGNHVALYRKTMSKVGTETFRLINNKFVTIDYDKIMFNRSKMNATDIPARNGLLNVLETRNEFFPNLYEYIKFNGENIDYFRQYLVARDTTYFMESSSIEGLPDENGNPTYVDSVYFQDNMMFNRSSYNPTGADANDAWMNSMKMLNARINMEDSAYVMVVPTDAAWAKATEEMSPYYNYGEGVYPRMSKVKNNATKNEKRDIKGARRTFANGRGYETVDSLQAVNIDMDIISPLAFNINLQPQTNGRAWTKESFMNGGYKTCEYLLTTVGDTIRDVKDENGNIIWRKDDLFEGGTITEMSNGYAIISDTWNYPRSLWMRDIDIDVNGGNLYGNIPTNTKYETIELLNSVAEDWIDEYGRCSEQRYVHITGSSNSANIPDIAFRLEGCKIGNADAMSHAKYDVQIVLVPLWYNQSDTTAVLPAESPEDAKWPKVRLICKLYAWDTSLIDSKDLSFKKQKLIAETSSTTPLEYWNDKVDTITIMENVEFPLSYKNIDDAHPVLHITSPRLVTADTRKGYCKEFNIDRVILKCKETK